MAKREIKEKELMEFLLSAGCREVTEADKKKGWYKRAAKKTSCLKASPACKVHK